MTLLDFIPSLQHAAPAHIHPAVWPMVAVAGGCPREIVRRETIADLLSRDRG
ncbi:MAG: hypothetical protein ACXWZI_10325 [Mycobacterium sp.]